MRLAEALIQRADCQKRLQQVRQRLLGNAKVQEGDEPSEDPKELIEELERTAAELLNLVSRINATNCTTIFREGITLSDALAERDVLMSRIKIYKELAGAASVIQSRTSKSEVKFKSTVSVRETQSQVDALSKRYRELDSGIQEHNWVTDLI